MQVWLGARLSGGECEGSPVSNHCQRFFFYSAFPWVSLPRLLNEFENIPSHKSSSVYA